MQELEKLVGKLADWNVEHMRYMNKFQRDTFDKAYNLLLDLVYEDNDTKNQF